jgi:hypothetical protein
MLLPSLKPTVSASSEQETSTAVASPISASVLIPGRPRIEFCAGQPTQPMPPARSKRFLSHRRAGFSPREALVSPPPAGLKYVVDY